MSAGRSTVHWLLHAAEDFDTALAMASLWLERSDVSDAASVYRLGGEISSEREAAWHQFVTRDGRLEHNAWLWLERAGGVVDDQARPVSVEEVEALPAGSIVLAPATVVTPPSAHACYLIADERGWRLDLAGDAEHVLSAQRDAFGRIVVGDQPYSVCGVGALRVLIAGEQEHLLTRYPAVLAALGDAADAMGIVVEPLIRSPRELDASRVDELIGDVDAIILPGGCDNSQVEGMIQLAGAALEKDIPTLGLCFGMQAMATAAIRTRLGAIEAQMEEVAPDAALLSITGMQDDAGGARHRLGDHPSQVQADTRLAAIHADKDLCERMNHRYQMASRWEVPLADVGIIVSARSTDGRTIADAIEATDCRFYLGYQGHPELISRRGSPHPAFVAMLNVALGGDTAAPAPS